MSAKIAKSAAANTTELTEKFAKELNKFFGWARDTGYKVLKGEKEMEWSLKLLKDFEEPGRNKMDAYIKALLKKYTINDNSSEEVDDYKVMLKDFKDNKPKRKRADTSTESSTQESSVIVDSTLDTTDTYYLETLEFDTNTLLKKLGKPVKNGGEKNRFEWKVKVGDNVYTIYDWANKEGEFESFADTEWHIGGFKANKKDIKVIVAFLNEKEIKKQKKAASKKKATEYEDTESDVSETESNVSQVSKAVESEEDNQTVEKDLEPVDDMFGDISDEDGSIDLDTIEDDE